MTEEAPAMHAANCKVDDCSWSTVAFDMITLYGDLEDHLKDEHDYSEEDWRDTREELGA